MSDAKRRIAQVAAGGTGMVLALASDGSAWRLESIKAPDAIEVSHVWVRLPPLPDHGSEG